MREIPLRPSISIRQVASMPTPRGDTTPSPVMTTLFMSVMSSRAVNVPVCQLFVGGIADVHDRDFEVQGLAGQRVVRVHGRVVAADRGHGRDQVPAFGLDLKARPDLDLPLRQLA